MSSARTENVLPALARLRRDDRGVQGEEVRLSGDLLDGVEDLADPRRVLGERASRRRPRPETAPRISCIPAERPRDGRLPRDDGGRDALGEARRGLGLAVRLGRRGADGRRGARRLAGEAGEVLDGGGDLLEGRDDAGERGRRLVHERAERRACSARPA